MLLGSTWLLPSDPPQAQSTPKPVEQQSVPEEKSQKQSENSVSLFYN